MDNFEYSIQLNDREWAEFLLASEECALAPAALATAEEQSLSDIEQGDGAAPGSSAGHSAAGPGTGPGAGTRRPVTRGEPAAASPSRHNAGRLAPGRDGQAEPGRAGGSPGEAEEPRRPSCAPMPSTQRRRPPTPPAAALAGGTAASGPARDEAAGGKRAMEPAGSPAASGGPERGRHAAGDEPRGGTGPEEPGSSAAAAARTGPGSAAQPQHGGTPREPPESLTTDTAPGLRQEASGERGGSEPSVPVGSSVGPSVGSSVGPSVGSSVGSTMGPSVGSSVGSTMGPSVGSSVGSPLGSPLGSPDVVRPKVPAQPRRSRKQRGAGAAEAAQGDREQAGAAAQRAAAPTKAPQSSPTPSRKSKGKEKAAKAAPVKMGSEEAKESKAVPGPGVDEGDEAVSSSPKLKVKEAEPQPLGKAKAAKQTKAGQAGGSGGRDNVLGAGAPAGQPCQEMPTKPLHPQSVGALGGDAAGEPAAEPPGKPDPPCCAAGASARADTLDVTWPEMYEYLFCDSQGEEEEGTENSVEGEKTPLEREMSLPELYEYFFNEPEGKRRKGKGKDRERKKLSSLDRAEPQQEDPASAPVKGSLVISVPEVYEHFFPDGPRNRAGWRGIFSVTPASEVKRAVGALKSLLQRHVLRSQEPAPQALVRRESGGKLPLVPLAPLGRGQAQPQGLDMALALTGRPEAPLALTHKDMCLVFCAFASWAVKTSDLQAPDAWKTMFLASFGTLSAIRYFRRQVREGHPQP
ncbi:PGC-1 and ERR-induced regulator in muscle protein 1 [Colius striatus]|nr:PGC-1 and ERR-induced regulator in muscle protein 1 [Colius striatus]